MNNYITYILFSRSKNKFYVGSTNNLSQRIHEHNSGQNKSTKFGAPWDLIFTKDFNSRSEAYQLEMKIKKRGIARFLNDQQNSS